MASGEPAKRRATFLHLLEGKSGLCSVVDYSYDTEKESWCQVTLRSDVQNATHPFLGGILFEETYAKSPSGQMYTTQQSLFRRNILFEEAYANFKF
jgi:hypothetical protein